MVSCQFAELDLNFGQVGIGLHDLPRRHDSFPGKIPGSEPVADFPGGKVVGKRSGEHAGKQGRDLCRTKEHGQRQSDYGLERNRRSLADKHTYANSLGQGERITFQTDETEV